ncbi:hypothetical protein F2Q69_00027959 [Brassica cretica]|uniref:Uncharacterized protein n=1 Tax=Brassica cretica TaxID=69181 RepID=A0A8S9S184_BRACR|nr:hypothetical protein F2Q69_00027959 [Brassica cretica]
MAITGDIKGDFTGDPTTTPGDPIASELGDPSETTADPGVTSSDAKAPTKVSLQETDDLLRSTTGDDVQATETTLSLPVPAAQSVGASETHHKSGVSSLALSTQSTDGGAASEGRDGGENLEKSLTGNHGEKAEGRNGGKQGERGRSGPWSKDLAGRGEAEPVFDIVDGHGLNPSGSRSTWGHKGQDCSSKEIEILSKRTGETTYASMPREGISVGGKGKEVDGSKEIGVKDDKISGGEETGIVEVVETMPKEGNAMEHLIKDLDELTPVASSDEKEVIKISESSKELSKTNTIDVWVNGKGVKASSDGKGEKEFMISPSRFSPLQDIDEEEETCLEESGTEVEEGEFRGNIVDGKKEKELQVASRSRQQGSVPRQLRGRVT